MMIRKFLQRIGILPAYTIDEFEDAKVENALYDHEKIIEKVRTTTRNQRTRNEQLRHTVNITKLRSLQHLSPEHHTGESNGIRSFEILG